MGSTPDITRIIDGIREAVTFEHVTQDMHGFRSAGMHVYDWSGQDRDGQPLTITWTAGKRSGLLLAAYEMTA